MNVLPYKAPTFILILCGISCWIWVRVSERWAWISLALLINWDKLLPRMGHYLDPQRPMLTKPGACAQNQMYGHALDFVPARGASTLPLWQPAVKIIKPMMYIL